MDADKDEGKIQLTLTIPKFPSEKPGGDLTQPHVKLDNSVCHLPSIAMV